MASDPASGIGVFTALAAGIVSFLSPCVLPLVPGYLSAVSGVAVSDLEEAGWRRVLAPALIFVASFSLIFILLGLGATGIGRALFDNRDTLLKISGVLITVMGVLFVASAFITRLNREWRVDALMTRAGRGGPLVAGAAFAIAWTPCIGPTLGSILSAASASGSELHGGVLLAVYSAGLGIPFLVTAIAFSEMTDAFSFIKRHYAVIIGIGGAILIATGILILTGEFTTLNVQAQKWTSDLGISP
jgi:cytochrome c-type biogenesis protein